MSSSPPDIPLEDFAEDELPKEPLPPVVELETKDRSGRRIKLLVDGRTAELLSVVDAETGKEILKNTL